MANPYDGSGGNIPYNGDNYPTNPWQQFQNSWLFHQNDNYVNGGALYQALNPGEVQYSEWSQQMVATMYQNWYNSAPEQMRRAMEAGINPFVASSGIAGSGSSGVASAPPTSQNNAPAMLGAAAQTLGSFGSSFGSIAQGVSTLAKLRHEIRNIDADTENTFESLGFTKLQSKAMSVQLKYMDQKEQIGVWQALATFDRTKAEYNNLLANHRNIIAQYDEIIAHKDLLIAQEGEVKARELYEKALKDKTAAEAAWQQTESDFFAAHGYKLGTPLYESLRDMMVSDGSFDMETFGTTISGYEGKITSAVESAKAEASWDYRPSNIAEAAAFAGQHLGESLRSIILSLNGSSSWPEFASKLRTNAAAQREFNQAYNDAREDLYETYLSKKRYYRNIRRGGNSQEVARAQNAMNTAKQEYESFTKEKFGLELLSKQFQDATKQQ